MTLQSSQLASARARACVAVSSSHLMQRKFNCEWGAHNMVAITGRGRRHVRRHGHPGLHAHRGPYHLPVLQPTKIRRQLVSARSPASVSRWTCFARAGTSAARWSRSAYDGLVRTTPAVFCDSHVGLKGSLQSHRCEYHVEPHRRF